MKRKRRRKNILPKWEFETWTQQQFGESQGKSEEQPLVIFPHYHIEYTYASILFPLACF